MLAQNNGRVSGDAGQPRGDALVGLALQFEEFAEAFCLRARDRDLGGALVVHLENVA